MEVSLYTGVQRIGDKFYTWQEMEDVCYCHKAIGVDTEDTLPWIPLTWKLARGEDYGSGLVEDYAGSFHSLSINAEATLDFTTIVTDLKMLVNPAGMTDVRTLNEAASGEYVQGREEDVFPLIPKVNDATMFLTNQFDKNARIIASAFLLNTMVTRDAERVTAEEIREQAKELESSLGGVYSRLAHELQLPLAKRLMAKQGEIFKSIEPQIVTGMESLSRNSDLANMRAFVDDLVRFSDVPESVAIRIDYNKLIVTLGAAHGVEYNAFLKPEDQVKQEQVALRKAQTQQVGDEAGAVANAQSQAGK